MTLSILFEDDALLIVNKPAGVVVTNAETVEGETVEEWARERTKDMQRGGIVHRLDKETSGCLILAKTSEAFVELQRQFKAREVQKEYLALVHGNVEPSEGTIRVPLARSRFDRQKFAVVPGGRMAETRYKVVSYYSRCDSDIVFSGAASIASRTGPVARHPAPTSSLEDLAAGARAGARLAPPVSFSLLRLFPKTGRTHQIRVHLQYFGHPIVADEKYAGEKRAREDRRWCPRLFLHAAKISFTHPVSKERVTFEVSLPEELASLLS